MPSEDPRPIRTEINKVDAAIRQTRENRRRDGGRVSGFDDRMEVTTKRRAEEDARHRERAEMFAEETYRIHGHR